MMNSAFAEELRGELRSPTNPTVPVKCRFFNMFWQPVQIVGVDDQGQPKLWATLKRWNEVMIDTFEGVKFRVLCTWSGSLIMADTIPAPPKPPHVDHWDFMLHPYYLAKPNHIGPPPRSTASMLIPNNGTRILVGSDYMREEKNNALTSVIVLRVQYWERSSESISLAYGQDKDVFTAQTAGRAWSSSSAETIAEEAGMSVSAGIGPFSASVSGSISQSSTTGFSATAESEEESVIETHVENRTKPARDITAFAWQLIDETLLVNGNVAKASYAVAQTPTVIELLLFPERTKLEEELKLADPTSPQAEPARFAEAGTIERIIQERQEQAERSEI